MVNPGQLGVTNIGVGEVEIGPLSTVYVESRARTDTRTIKFEVTVRKEWTGELKANIAVTESRWEQVPDAVAAATPVPAPGP
jgi:hypothetical protein